MSFELIAALIVFAAASTFSPGPNNIMLMASGANFGLRRTLPHWSGIISGLMSLVMVAGFGLAAVFDLIPGSREVLKFLAIGYLLWLAWKIMHASAPSAGDADAKPMTWAQAALFQWVNPKAWAMALSALSAYAPGDSLFAVLVVALILGLTCIPSGATWILLGQQLRRWLINSTRQRAFNWTMAGLLVLSIWPAIIA